MIFVCLFLAFLAYIYLQNNWIDIEHIDVKINDLPKGLQGLKIAHISDVHIPRNASTIINLINKVHKENPDIIVMTGDILDRSGDINDPNLSKLCMGLVSIAPTYAVAGNHEADSDRLNRWKKILQANNVKIVENKIEIYRKNNAMLAIMGLSDNRKYSYKYFNNIEAVKNIPRILLAHRPEIFYTYSSNSYSIKPDLVFSGHAHGGQFRIPLLNIGIVAPGQGFFPNYTSGLYTSTSGVQMVVSRGLGNSIFPIRINDRPHLPIIRLISGN